VGTETVERLDVGRLSQIERTPQGGLRIPAHLTRTGVFAYTLPDGSVRRELRHPDEVFAKDSLATLSGAPVTNRHPATPVRPNNWRKLSVGHVGEDVKADGRFVAAPILVQDASTISDVDKGDLKEISCGYSCRLDNTPGEHNGEHYDAVQTSIKYNHVALGPKGWGRAGNEVALRLDSNGNQIERQEEIMPTKTIRIDGVDYEVGSDAHLSKVESMHKAKLDTVTAKADDEKKRADAAEGERDGLKKELAEANDPKRLDGLVSDRVALVSTARKVLGDEEKLDGKTDREIMIATIRHDDEDFDAEGKSDEYVRAYFEATAKGSTRRQDAGGIKAVAAAAREASAKGGDKGKRQDGGGEQVDRFDAKAAQQRMHEHNRELASQPLRFTRSN